MPTAVLTIMPKIITHMITPNTGDTSLAIDSIGIGKSATVSRRESRPALMISIKPPSPAPPRMPPQIAVFSPRAAPPRIASIGAPATTLYETYRKAPSNQ
ncbi:hypothetical protein D3C79_769700 [compost metagenome]